MTTTFVKKLATSTLLILALLVSYPSQADHTYPTLSKKEIRQEARSLKLRGKRLQEEGKEMIRESRIIKAEYGDRKEARKIRREGRLLLKKGKTMEQKGRLLRKGKISYYAAMRY
jgi:hypothetical protein